MRVIHVLRKPLSEGTVAANVVKHGCGGLNIDASRIGTTDNLNGGAYAEDGSVRHDGAENWRYKRGEQGNAGEYQPPSGRWPGNLILQHLAECECDGVKRVKAITGGMKSGSTGAFGKHGVYGTAEGLQNKVEYGDADGKETLANWICEPGCPVARLDEQSGVSTSTGGGMNRSGTGNLVYSKQSGHPKVENVGHGDVGGASRYFKQVGGAE